MAALRISVATVLLAALLLAIASTIILSLIPVYLPNRSVTPGINTKALRIAIVGAGISGLNAGLTLVDSNSFSAKNIFIYEANTNIGGRMHTRLWSPDNQTSEWCGEYIDSNNYVMRNLTQRFDINIFDTIEGTNELYDTTYYFLNRFYNETQAFIDYKVVEPIIIQQIEQIGDINYNQSNEYGRFFDNLSLYDWIERYVPGGHQSDFGQYIDSAYQQEYGLDTEELTSLLFLFTIGPDSQPENGPLSIYGLSDQRYRMLGGNAQLPRKIGQYLTERGVRIQLDHSLTKIVKLRNNKYRLTFANNRTFIFDQVILTIPLTTLRNVDYSQAQFDQLKTRVINEIKYGTNTKINVQFSRRFWYDLSADGIIYTDLPFLNSWEESLGQAGDTGILVLFTGGTEGTLFAPRRGFDVISNSSGNISAAIYLRNFLNDLDEIWPNSSQYYTGEASVSAPWFDKFFLGSYPAYILGQYATLHGYESVRQDNVHFAGDYASIDYLGLMEGAASEGERAANEVINDYK